MKEKISISKVKGNPNNPRIIKNNKFKKLVKSIKEFPEMLKLRPIVVDEDMMVLGGNMRLKASIEAGLKEVWIDKAEGLSEEQKQEFVIKDNLSFGEWDWDLIANDWTDLPLETWSMDLPLFKENAYTKNIKSPEYKAKGAKPEMFELYNDDKTEKLIEKINNADISEEDKTFLKKAAYRHIVFNYENIAEFYTHSSKEVQELMEESALVIIDLKSAINNNFVQMTEFLTNFEDDE